MRNGERVDKDEGQGTTQDVLSSTSVRLCGGEANLGPMSKKRLNQVSEHEISGGGITYLS